MSTKNRTEGINGVYSVSFVVSIVIILEWTAMFGVAINSLQCFCF